jgi:pimeloyl-ACP methyl ester carboxylesterase
MTIVLLPGMDGTGALFEPFASLMASRFNVKIVQYPASDPLDYSELEAVARAAIPNEGPFVILGESFSGPIAISLAESCSSQLKGVILSCSFACNPRPYLRGFQWLVGMLPVAISPKAVLSFLLLEPFATGALQSALSAAITRVSPPVLRARLKSVLTVDVSEKLASLAVPILYLRASHDRVVPRKASEYICKLCPRTKVVQIEAPHLLLQAAPAEASKAIGAFIQEVQYAL